MEFEKLKQFIQDYFEKIHGFDSELPKIKDDGVLDSKIAEAKENPQQNHLLIMYLEVLKEFVSYAVENPSVADIEQQVDDFIESKVKPRLKIEDKSLPDIKFLKGADKLFMNVMLNFAIKNDLASDLSPQRSFMLDYEDFVAQLNKGIFDVGKYHAIMDIAVREKLEHVQACMGEILAMISEDKIYLQSEAENKKIHEYMLKNRGMISPKIYSALEFTYKIKVLKARVVEAANNMNIYGDKIEAISKEEDFYDDYIQLLINIDKMKDELIAETAGKPYSHEHLLDRIFSFVNKHKKEAVELGAHDVVCLAILEEFGLDVDPNKLQDKGVLKAYKVKDLLRCENQLRKVVFNHNASSNSHDKQNKYKKILEFIFLKIKEFASTPSHKRHVAKQLVRGLKNNNTRRSSNKLKKHRSR